MLATSEIKRMEIVAEIEIEASPERVFAALTEGIGGWWTHSFRSPATVRLEAKVGGRFGEFWSEDEGALYGTVTRIKRGELLMYAGPMGMSGAVHNVIEFKLSADGTGTRVEFSHHGMGDIDEATEASYRGGWDDLLNNCLKPYAETGAAPQSIAAE